jgi:4-hydroxybenzoyl-CoA reductase subunit beta
VATASKRCVAMSSTDCAPALLALGARIKLVSVRGERVLALEDLYKNDGIDYLTRAPDEVLTQIDIPDKAFVSTYWKLRRRGAFDFPVLGVAAAARISADGSVEEARIALGAVASRPFLVEKAGEFLKGRKLDDAVIAETSRLVASRAKPMDNADLDLYWRKEVTGEFVAYALRELRGDDMSEARLRVARQMV